MIWTDGSDGGKDYHTELYIGVSDIVYALGKPDYSNKSFAYWFHKYVFLLCNIINQNEYSNLGYVIPFSKYFMDKKRDELLTANVLSISEGNYDINNLWIMIENKKFPSLENKGIFNSPLPFIKDYWYKSLKFFFYFYYNLLSFILWNFLWKK